MADNTPTPGPSRTTRRTIRDSEKIRANKASAAAVTATKRKAKDTSSQPAKKQKSKSKGTSKAPPPPPPPPPLQEEDNEVDTEELNQELIDLIDSESDSEHWQEPERQEEDTERLDYRYFAHFHINYGKTVVLERTDPCCKRSDKPDVYTKFRGWCRGWWDSLIGSEDTTFEDNRERFTSEREEVAVCHERQPHNQWFRTYVLEHNKLTIGTSAMDCMDQYYDRKKQGLAVHLTLNIKEKNPPPATTPGRGSQQQQPRSSQRPASTATNQQLDNLRARKRRQQETGDLSPIAEDDLEVSALNDDGDFRTLLKIRWPCKNLKCRNHGY